MKFPFPVVACTSWSKFVKLLQEQVQPVNFTSFWRVVCYLAQLCDGLEKKYGNVCFSSTRLYLNALKFILIVLQRQPKHCKSCNMFPNCGRLYGRRLEKLYRQRKSFKIAIPGIWTLYEKICSMLHRSGGLNEILFTRNVIFYPYDILVRRGLRGNRYKLS